MKHLIIILISFQILITGSCSTGKSINQKTVPIDFSIRAGINHGGITENTDLSVISNSNIDAYTGATKIGFNGGLHLSIDLKKNQLESGVDYMFNHQIFNFHDEKTQFSGVRELFVNQIIFPLTFNFRIFNKQYPQKDLLLKLGYVGQLNMVQADDKGKLPEFEINKWSNGITFGLSAYLIQLKNKNKIGIYLDCYRGSIMYKDYYNLPEYEMPGTSFIKFGVQYQF
ncbi:MAG: hypothetical protein L3J74_05765 [Bacteroidales bacterium]|nr:hypothetical protein [Bacteroidales bacterium]